jgi:hypothetical protein
MVSPFPLEFKFYSPALIVSTLLCHPQIENLLRELEYPTIPMEQLMWMFFSPSAAGSLLSVFPVISFKTNYPPTGY